MNIAILHYHLKTGGVTTVIRQQVEALKNQHNVVVFTGSPPDKEFPGDVVVIEGLEYDQFAHHAYDSDAVAESIIHAMDRKFGGACDVLHVHNPLLAKNKNFIGILKSLQQKGILLFLQVHDFAEDGRPNVYYAKEEYPENCHYGVLNSRDYEFLLASGLTANGLHKLPNVITPPPSDGHPISKKNIVLYPVRAIRRKNIGEAILLSCYFTENETLMITRAPNSKEDLKSYSDWKTFIATNRLNVALEAGMRYRFRDLIKTAKFMLTTSISEGFGFSFLEPWIANKQILGRKLPGICTDFEQNDIDLNLLYPKIMIPIKWIGKDALKTKWIAHFKTACQLFNQHVIETDIENQFEVLTKKDLVDFGLLSETFQKTVLLRIISNVRDKKEILELNPEISNLIIRNNYDYLIQKNKKAVLTHYNQMDYGKKLTNVYEKVKNQAVIQRIEKPVLFSKFIEATGFSLLKWSSYDG